MAERTHAHTSRPPSAATLQRTPADLTVSTPGDRYEREADRIADAVTGGGAAHEFSLSRLGGGQVQRQDDAKPKSNEEKQREAALKAAEAFLATSYGKQLKEAVANDPVVKGVTDAASSFVSTLPGKVVTGSVAVGVVAALGATGQALPFQVPEIPLDRLTPGLSMKVTYEGAVANPSKALLTFTYKPPGAKATGPTEAERVRAETAKLAAEQAKFRAGLRYAPGSKEAREQEAQEAAVREVVGLGKLPGQATRPKASLGFDSGSQLVPPSTGFKPKPISLLDEELKLKPLTEVAPAEAVEKKDEGGGIQRKVDGDAPAGTTSTGVRDTLGATGQGLDVRTRSRMEARFGHDFSHVRVHTDARAQQSARSVSALAYTSGADIVFAPGHYDPHTLRGQNLLAHELAHVVQQTGGAAAPGFVQRRSVLESIGIFFGLVEGDFSDDELEGYLQQVTKTDRIEGAYDSDNKARAIVRKWKAGNAKFGLTPGQKVLLIREMIDGPTLDDDENAILDLLRLSHNIDLAQLLGPDGVSLDTLDSHFQGDEQDSLDAFIEARFTGGRKAVAAGKVEPQGKPAQAAPQTTYDWPALRARLEGNAPIADIVADIGSLAPIAREQAQHDLVRERLALDQRRFKLIDEFNAAPPGPVQEEVRTRGKYAVATRARIEDVLQTLFRDIALTEDSTALLGRTTTPSATQKAAIAAALTPPVKRDASGTPEVFVDTLPGEQKNYEQKLRELMATVIRDHWDSLVKDKGRAEHADPDKVHSLQEMEDIGKVARNETNAVFGQYYDQAAHPELKADRPGRAGNIHDEFAVYDKRFRRMTGPQLREQALGFMRYLLDSNDQVRELNRAHNAAPAFDARYRPGNDEARAQAKVAGEFTRTNAQVKTLNEVERGWGGSADHSGNVYVGVFKSEDTDKDRAFLWESFQTLIHEYMHTLNHADYETFAGEHAGTARNTLIEGVTTLFSETVWLNVQPRLSDPALRLAVEGPTYSKLPAIEVGRPARYASIAEALQLVGVVGIRNLYAAYFLGEVEKLGGTRAPTP